MTAVSDQSTETPIPRTRHWWMVPLVLAVVAVLLLLAYGLYLAGGQQVGQGAAPPFTLTTFDGQVVRVPDPQGRPVVVNFWASWCIPCRDEAPILEQAWRDYGDQVLFVGVDYVDTEREALAFIEEFGVTYPNGPDLGSRISDAYRIQGVPETFFIGGDGTIKGYKIGPIVNRAELDGFIGQITE